jgi:two-component system cell cycle response regulator
MATLLLIEDSPSERSRIRDLIAEAGLFQNILEADDGLSGIKTLLSEPVDFVLSDLEMPHAGGEKVLAIRNSLPKETPQIPLVILTANPDYGRNAGLLRGGASDVITKPYFAEDLVARVALQVKIMRLQRKLSKKVEMLEQLTTTDPLTGLRNQAHLSEALAVEFERAQRYRMPLSVVMADLTDFKGFNAAHGKRASDALLQGVADLLRWNLRKSDIGGRWETDQFLAILAHSHAEGADVFAQRWRRQVASMDVPAGEGGVTLNIGIASYIENFASPGDLIDAAHVALREAKAVDS